MQKTITFGIPCYNSAAYMDHCITSILQGTGYAQDVQIVVVDHLEQEGIRVRISISSDLKAHLLHILPCRQRIPGHLTSGVK